MGIQNFIITIEMFFGAIMLCLAFPYKIYMRLRCDEEGRGLPLQKISSKLVETLNPKDIVEDAVHNFIPAYHKYAQHTRVQAEADEMLTNGVGRRHSHEVDEGEGDSMDDERTRMLASDSETWCIELIAMEGN